MSISLLKKRIVQWKDDESGSIGVEVCMMAPLLAWAWIATTTYFDAYRNEALSYKAGITISDMFSRETFVTPDFITGASGLLEFLAINDDDPDLRVTAFSWDADESKYNAIWSEERGPRDGLVTADLSAMTDRLPNMTNGEVALLVETWIDYVPPFNVGLDAFEMTTYTVISPRFSTQICLEETPDDNDPSDAICS